MKLRLGIVGLGLIWENIHMPCLLYTLTLPTKA